MASLNDCIRSLKIPSDDAADIRRAAGDGDPAKGVQRYIDTLMDDVEDLRGQLKAQGFDLSVASLAKAKTDKVATVDGTKDQFVIPGAEQSAKQAAEARGDKIKAKKPQKEAGGMFAEPDKQGTLFAEEEGRDDPKPEEAKALQDAIEGKTVHQVAQYLTKNAKSLAHQVIAAKVATQLLRLEKAGVKFTFNVSHIGTKITSDVKKIDRETAPAGLGGRGVRGITHHRYERDDNQINIWINGADVTGKVGMTDTVVLHELVHAATQSALRIGGTKGHEDTPIGRLSADMDKVTSAIFAHFNSRVKIAKYDDSQPLTSFEDAIDRRLNNAIGQQEPYQYGRNAEIVAWALTDQRMQKWLETIPYKGSNLWSLFVQAIRRYLGLEASKETALSEVLRVSEQLLEADVPSMKSLAGMVDQSLAKDKGKTDTKAFKAWFKDSKVVDADGKPLVVYHGTNQPLDRFSMRRGGKATGDNGAAKQGIFFTSSTENANDYAANAGKVVVADVVEHEKLVERLKAEAKKAEREAQRAGQWEKAERAMQAWEDAEIGAINADDVTGQNVTPVYLSIKNPKVLDFEGGRLPNDFDEQIADAKANGHDGVIIKNVTDPPPHVADHYVVFDAAQVKSVFNKGTWSPTDARIQYSAGTTPAYGYAQEDVRKAVLDAIRRVGGDKVKVSFEDVIFGDGSALEASGGGQVRREVAGAYNAVNRLVRVSLSGKSDPLKTGLHEIFHDLQSWKVFADNERRALDGSKDRFQSMARADGLDPSKMSQNELEAVAFSHYAAKKLAGEKVTGLLPGVIRAFQKVSNLLAAIKNWLNGHGFMTADDVFDKALSGEMNQRADRNADDVMMDELFARDGYSAPTYDESVTRAAVDYYGITTDPREAGYVLPDGRMLDLSDGNAGKRTLDHTDLPEIVPQVGGDEPGPTIELFMRKTGAIRVDFKHGIVSAVGMPTNKQLQAIVRGRKTFGEGDLSLDRIGDKRRKGGQIQDVTLAKLHKFFGSPNDLYMEQYSVATLDEKARDLYTGDAGKDVRSKATRDISKRLRGSEMEAKPIWQRVRARIDEFREHGAKSVLQGIADAYYSVADLERRQNAGELMDASKSAYKAVHATKNLGSVMAVVLNHAPVTLEDGGFVQDKSVSFKGGFQGIFENVLQAGEIELFKDWLIARRAQRLIGEGRENLLDQKDIDAIMSEAKSSDARMARFKTADDRWQEFNGALLDTAVKAGRLSKEQAAIWKASGDYVPFYRMMDEGDRGPHGSKGGLRQGGPLSAPLKGGRQQLGDPIENMVLSMTKIVDSSFKNEALRRVIDLAVDAGVAVKRPGTSQPYTQERVAALLQENGIDPKNVPADEREKWIKMLTSMVEPPGDGVTVWRNGTAEKYDIYDPFLMRSLTSLSPAQLGGLMKVLRGARRLLTEGVTMSPAFMAANFIRDSLSTWAVGGQKGYNPLVDGPKGLLKAWKRDPSLIAIMAAGGGGQGHYDITAGDVRKQLEAKLRGVDKNRIADSVKKSWELWHRIGQASEQANRIAIYNHVIAGGGSAAEAAYQARDLLDFSMRGDYAAVRFLTETVPFLNARIQGLYRLYRGAVKGAPDSPKGVNKQFLMVGMLLMGASLALAMANNGDDRYEGLEDWDKDTYWHFWVGDDHWRIPKPFEVGALFATLPERLVRLMRGDDESKRFVDRMVQMVGSTFAVDVRPQLLKPMIEAWANKDSFTGAPIIPQRMKGLKPEAQYNAGTSEFARIMGHVMPETLNQMTKDGLGFDIKSPLVVDHLVRGYLGEMGNYLVAAADAGASLAGAQSVKPTKRLSDYPVVSRFYRGNDVRAERWVSDFYDMREETEAVANTIRAYAQRGETERAREMMEDVDVKEKMVLRGAISGAYGGINKINDLMRKVNDSKTLSADQKRKMIDDLTGQRNKLAKAVVKRAPAIAALMQNARGNQAAERKLADYN